MPTQSRLPLLILLLINFFSFALITNIIGVLLPFWKDEFGLSSTVVSLLGSAFFLAYGITSLPQGVLIDKIGGKKTFFWALFLVLVGSLAFALFPNFPVGLFSLFVIGTGVTALQLIGNLLVKKIDDDASKYSRNLTLAQVLCGIGGSAGGVLIGLVSGNWTMLYYLFVLISVLLTIFLIFTPIPESNQDAQQAKTQSPSLGDYLRLAQNPLMILFALGIFVYVGIEVGIANWLSTFLVEMHTMNKVDAAKFVSLYWLLQSIGRFTGGIVLNFIDTSRALILYAAACLISLLLAVFVPIPQAAGWCFASVGFFTSIMFPSIFSLAVNSFDKSQEGTVAGILCTTIVGGAVTTPLIGVISDTSGSLATGLVVSGAVSFIFIGIIGLRTLASKDLINARSN
ncbi:MAG: MFS transporter [Candidatus Caenarcaniphilales bacterium]|nr:MFS transporter [Candidatus Caenarcaniphilales bacterium]